MSDSDEKHGVWYQAACSGLWYRNRGSAGDVSAIKAEGEIFPVDRRPAESEGEERARMKPLNCKCGKHPGHFINVDGPGFQITCIVGCGRTGPKLATWNEAVTGWNEGLPPAPASDGDGDIPSVEELAMYNKASLVAGCRELHKELATLKQRLVETQRFLGECERQFQLKVDIINQRDGQIATLKQRVEELTGMKFSDRMYHAIKSRMEVAEDRLNAIDAMVEAAISDEPECPGVMPDAMWEAMNGDKDATEEAFRITVRETKRGILERYRVALSAHDNQQKQESGGADE